MSDYRISRSTPESTLGLIGAGVMVVVLATLPWWDSDGSLQTPLVVVLYYLSLAQMWNLLAGFAGLVSVGQQMFVGIGIYSVLQAQPRSSASIPSCRCSSPASSPRCFSLPVAAVRLPTPRAGTSPSAPGWWPRCSVC